MKIINKLSLLFTTITAAILLGFAGITYYSADKNRESEFYKSLRKEAITKANIFFTAKVDAKVLQAIYINNRKILNEVEVAIYDTSANLLYHDAIEIDLVKETDQMFGDINSKGEITFYEEKRQVVGLLFPFNGKNYIVTATAYDQYGYDKLENLNKTMLIVFMASILMIYFAGRFFSKKALLPVSKIVKRVKKINASNLDLRLSSTGKDELSELANTFNETLDRLQSSFENQKHFVSNISHELNTPLAAVIIELELTLSKNDLEIKGYQSVINDVLHDARKLSKLVKNLFDFSKASYDPGRISFREIRLDEILLDAQEHVVRLYSNYKIRIGYGEEKIREGIIINGNEYLLRTAFMNLMENACKFSGDACCTVLISFRNEGTILNFIDTGIGINEEDLGNIFNPFYRGTNYAFAEGNGIGLTLVKKIIELHKGRISVSSTVNQGSNFSVDFSIY
ncbi:HAMP domain-containing sensor histidine kinase [Leptospira ilyithenensis]|uniref:histidine kinase n=1 Tax=Leptospira ilyithenensis TaxID=2484901 RepID=A0A4R9LQC1_9LEPT|nr:HAMP domain-containing sensor histidine kinase [Leptospira ilyithenensis]TGN11628.1 sensor histidine kinase [Leptospira ilyithenensis]